MGTKKKVKMIELVIEVLISEFDINIHIYEGGNLENGNLLWNLAVYFQKVGPN